MGEPTRRFSNRVDNYVKYRPSYPEQVITALGERCGLTSASSVADVGAGTGKLTELLLRNGNRVYAVEPNPEMRAAAERLLASHPGFVSVDGQAEQTTLPDGSVDLVTAGQAFHWFDQTAARQEFARILRPGGWVALIWNIRLNQLWSTTRDQASPFMQAYEDFLQSHGTDYPHVTHHVDDDTMAGFFGAPCGRVSIPYSQRFDLAGLRGRTLSSSYIPAPGHPGHEAMLAALEELFHAHARHGQVSFEYETQVYYGRLEP